MDFRERIYAEFKRGIIARQIFCPVTNKVLDIRTAKWAVDVDGDPAVAFDPSVTDQQVVNYLEGIS